MHHPDEHLAPVVFPERASSRARTAVARRPMRQRIAPGQLMPPENRYRPDRHANSARALQLLLMGTLMLLFLGWFSTLLWPATLLLGAAASLTLFDRRGDRSSVDQNLEAIQMLNAGQVERAAQSFEELTRREQRSQAHPVYVYNRAVAYMLQGRLRRAFSLFNAVEKSRQFARGPARSYEPLLYIEMTACLGLLGWLEEAERTRAKAARRLPRDEGARLAFADAVLCARRADWPGVMRTLERHWQQAEELLRVPTLRALHLVGAFALERMGRDHTPSFRNLLDGCRPARPDEFAWVASEWPELRDFLCRRGFTRP